MQLPPPLPLSVQIASKFHFLLRSSICISSLIFVYGFFFIVEFVAGFFSFTKVRDSFIVEMFSFLLLLILFCVSLVRLIIGLFRRTKLYGGQICRLLLIVGFVTIFFYRDEAKLLGDKMFFWINEADFKNKVPAGGTDYAILLNSRSSANFYKFFIYTGGISLPEGRKLSSSEKNSLRVLDEIKACPAEAQKLKERFYVVSIYCG